MLFYSRVPDFQVSFEQSAVRVLFSDIHDENTERMIVTVVPIGRRRQYQEG